MKFRKFLFFKIWYIWYSECKASRQYDEDKTRQLSVLVFQTTINSNLIWICIYKSNNHLSQQVLSSLFSTVFYSTLVKFSLLK